jgi:hypothetical protein
VAAVHAGTVDPAAGGRWPESDPWLAWPDRGRRRAARLPTTLRAAPAPGRAARRGVPSLSCCVVTVEAARPWTWHRRRRSIGSRSVRRG